METKQPTLGDRVMFSNPMCEADRFGNVIAKRETRFGVDFEVELDGGEIKAFARYSGTCEEIKHADGDSYGRCLNHGGIGTYLVVKVRP